MKKHKILTILGTRPEIIRLSCIIPKLDAACDHYVLHTGQNYDPNLNEFLQRIKHMNLKIKFISDPYVIHQYHSKSYGHPDNPIPTVDNQVLFQHTIDSKKIRAENKENICGI